MSSLRHARSLSHSINVLRFPSDRLRNYSVTQFCVSRLATCTTYGRYQMTNILHYKVPAARLFNTSCEFYGYSVNTHASTNKLCTIDCCTETFPRRGFDYTVLENQLVHANNVCSCTTQICETVIL